MLLLPLVTVATNEDAGITTATPGHEYCDIKEGGKERHHSHSFSASGHCKELLEQF